MKILILGGFLGSGKTSVLLQLAHYLVDQSSNDQRTQVAIIENEIGQIGIDDKILRQNGYTVKDIFSGCVCCTLNGDLITGIQDIQKMSEPDWMIIEATGVAFPDKIADSIFKCLGLTCQIVTLVDAKRWKRIHVPLENLIEGQLNGANFILINKIDLVDEDELNIVEKELSYLNQSATIYKINSIKPINEEILEVIENG